MDRGGAVKCSTTVTGSSDDGYAVLLTKLTPGALSESDLPHGVAVSTVTASPVAALYHSLHNVYLPLLQQQGGDGDGGGRVQVRPSTHHESDVEAGGHCTRASQEVGADLEALDH
jgi:hypothetical protein